MNAACASSKKFPKVFTGIHRCNIVFLLPDVSALLHAVHDVCLFCLAALHKRVGHQGQRAMWA